MYLNNQIIMDDEYSVCSSVSLGLQYLSWDTSTDQLWPDRPTLQYKKTKRDAKKTTQRSLFTAGSASCKITVFDLGFNFL